MEKNKIIAISGQPVTGKGTTVKALIEKFKKHGYSEENIHVRETGHEFRDYFEAIFEFIKNYEDSEEIEKLSQDPYLKVFSEKREYREALIDTILKLKQNGVDTRNLTIEQANNLKEFSPLRKVLDKIIDTSVAEQGKWINSETRPDEMWIIDSRLAFYNIPESFSIRLVSNPQVAAERYFNDDSRKEDDSYSTIKEAFEAREKRRIGEQKRYLKRYGVDLEAEDNYDLIIDTSYATTEDIASTILKCMDCYTKGEPFAKKWTSPKTLLPLQSDMRTMKKGEAGYNLDEIEKFIKENGYLPNEAIEVIEVDGIKYIINGHHRNFAVAHNQGSLVPYEVIAKDDDILPDEYRGRATESARNRANTVERIFVQNHEYFIGEDFSYEEVYPGIYERLKQLEEIGEGR